MVEANRKMDNGTAVASTRITTMRDTNSGRRAAGVTGTQVGGTIRADLTFPAC